MLEQGFDADSADYDGRTALMLSAGKGHTGADEDRTSTHLMRMGARLCSEQADMFAGGLQAAQMPSVCRCCWARGTTAWAAAHCWALCQLSTT